MAAHRAAAALAFVLLIAAAAPVAAQQNLLANGEFDVDLLGWSGASDEIWSPMDVDGSGSSGSIEIRSDGDPGTGAYVWQCVAVIGGGTYTFGASLYATGFDATGRAEVGLGFYTTPDCLGAALGGEELDSTTTGQWIDLEQTIAVPEDANRAGLMLVATKLTGAFGDPWTVLYDHARLVPEAEGGALGLASIAALLVLGRRGRA